MVHDYMTTPLQPLAAAAQSRAHHNAPTPAAKLSRLRNITPTHPRPTPDNAPCAPPRGPATPFSHSPGHCAHNRNFRALSAPHLRHAFAPAPETPSNHHDFASRTVCAHPNTISALAHTRITPTSRGPKTQSAPYHRLRRPEAARDPPRNAGNCDADAMRPSAASPDKNSGSQGRGQGRAGGWPR